ncbi:MAG: uroporphyrinogen-III synthase [Gammaproteobacteria bacterium]
MKPLAGLGVLVTRPAAQAAPLCRMLEAEGATVIAFPTIVIESVPGLDELRETLHALQPIDLAIFISPNAVAHGAGLVLGLASRPKVAAIGRSTAGALEAAGLPVDVRPARGHTSEDLLGEPDLNQVAGLRIAIMRGGPGRELLASELAARGAEIHAFDVYARRAPYVNEHDIATLTARWRRREIDVVVATSVESLARLHELLGDAATESIRRSTILTSSARVNCAAQSLGHFAPSVIATGPDARSLVAALVDWRGRKPEETHDRE